MESQNTKLSPKRGYGVKFAEDEDKKPQLVPRASRSSVCDLRTNDSTNDEAVVSNDGFEGIIGCGVPLSEVLDLVRAVAPTESTVLIQGETGTGKELIARAIHKRSNRSHRAFVSVNCGALAPSLIASELFGHEKGAFTGAVQQRRGRFELATGGTIFLDEVGELPPDTQVALLRVLQEREFERVGGTRSIQVDVRVIAATNRDLEAAVVQGTFRSDLFYRLNVFPIDLPPLRERKEDIPMLIEHFVQHFSEKIGKQFCKISSRTLELCQSYYWLGNIRELQNIVERSVIRRTGNTFWIDEEALFSQRAPGPESGLRLKPIQHLQQDEPASYDERKIIEDTLRETRGRVYGPRGAAMKLRIPVSTLESRIKALNICKAEFKFS